MAGGDTYTIIYLKMQLLSLRTDGVLQWTGLEESFADELALDLDETPEDVEVTLLYLLKTGLAETVDNISFLLPWVLENTGSETATTQRVRDFRERQKLKALQCNTDETEVKRACNVEIEKELDIELEKETEQPPRPSKSDIDRVVEAWNSLGLSKVTKIPAGSDRYNLLNKRLKDFGVDAVLQAIENIRQSSFLNGNNSKGWFISFDWFVKPNNFPKVLDGNYADSKPQQQPVANNKKYSTGETYKPPVPTAGTQEDLMKRLQGLVDQI